VDDGTERRGGENKWVGGRWRAKATTRLLGERRRRRRRRRSESLRLLAGGKIYRPSG